jgi:hypothetical protein
MSATGSGNAGIGKVAAEAGVIVSDIEAAR